MNAKKSRLILVIAGSLSLAGCNAIPELAELGFGGTEASESRAAGSSTSQAATRSQAQTGSQSAPLNQRVSDNPFHEDDDSGDTGGDTGGDFDGGGFDSAPSEPDPSPPSWTG